eukprot:gene4507-5523_t
MSAFLQAYGAAAVDFNVTLTGGQTTSTGFDVKAVFNQNVSDFDGKSFWNSSGLLYLSTEEVNSREYLSRWQIVGPVVRIEILAGMVTSSEDGRKNVASNLVYVTFDSTHNAGTEVYYAGTPRPWLSRQCITPLDMLTFVDDCPYRNCSEGGCFQEQCEYNYVVVSYVEKNLGSTSIPENSTDEYGRYMNRVFVGDKLINEEWFAPLGAGDSAARDINLLIGEPYREDFTYLIEDIDNQTYTLSLYLDVFGRNFFAGYVDVMFCGFYGETASGAPGPRCGCYSELSPGEGLQLAGDLVEWEDYKCVYPEEAVWQYENGTAAGFGEGIEGVMVSFSELELSNTYGSFAQDAGYTKITPPYFTSLFQTIIDDPSNCDLCLDGGGTTELITVGEKELFPGENITTSFFWPMPELSHNRRRLDLRLQADESYYYLFQNQQKYYTIDFRLCWPGDLKPENLTLYETVKDNTTGETSQVGHIIPWDTTICVTSDNLVINPREVNSETATWFEWSYVETNVGYATVNLSGVSPTGGWQNHFFLDGKQIDTSGPRGALRVELNFGAPDIHTHFLEIELDAGWQVEPEVDEWYNQLNMPDKYTHTNNRRGIYFQFCGFSPVLSSSGMKRWEELRCGLPLKPSMCSNAKIGGLNATWTGVGCIGDENMVHTETERVLNVSYYEDNIGQMWAQVPSNSTKDGWLNVLRFNGSVIAENYPRLFLEKGDSRLVDASSGAGGLQLPGPLLPQRYHFTLTLDALDEVAWDATEVAEEVRIGNSVGTWGGAMCLMPEDSSLPSPTLGYYNITRGDILADRVGSLGPLGR